MKHSAACAKLAEKQRTIQANSLANAQRRPRNARMFTKGSSRLIVNSTQILLAVSLAMAIVSMTLMIVDFMPERADQTPRSAAMYNQTFLCLILPLVVAYVSQNAVIGKFTRFLRLSKVGNPFFTLGRSHQASVVSSSYNE